MNTMPSEVVDEASARSHLAALYRLVNVHFPSTDGIYNHISLRIPGTPDWFLVKRHELLYEEVKASNLAVADLTKDLDERSGVNRPGFVLHSAILRARPDVNCVLHMHSISGLAMSAHAGGLKMLSQNSMRFWERIGYHPYEGITEDEEEGPRVAQALGPDYIAVMLRNHGFAVVGRTPRDAFERTRDLVIACETQLLLEASGAELVEVPLKVREKVKRQLMKHDAGRGGADWAAWLRHLERIDPSYRD